LGNGDWSNPTTRPDKISGSFVFGSLWNFSISIIFPILNDSLEGVAQEAKGKELTPTAVFIKERLG
jgi:hypothetical protein